MAGQRLERESHAAASIGYLGLLCWRRAVKSLVSRMMVTGPSL
jgi:hypothetical protein